ncbi:MAG TPA: M56 family metallopeptidase [Bryobacteraceae bacterium]|nr:M56 family metallopeptidase [Bryobacteraceae bacterium]
MTGTDFAAAGLAAALNTLWIALAMAAAAWMLARFLRTNAATRHLLWWIVLALVLILPFAALQPRSDTASASMPEAPAAIAITSPAVAAPAPAEPRTSARNVFPLELRTGDWMALLACLWLPFALVQLGRNAWSFLYLWKLKRRSRPAADALLERMGYWMETGGIRRPVRLLISDRVGSPLAMGFRRPAVILPSTLLSHFNEGELDHVLLHELAHMARRDDWSNLLARVIGAFAGWHPVVAWSLRQIARERELACDEWVVAHLGEARPYAASLARLFELCRARRRVMLATGMAESASRLGERIERLLAGGRQFTSRASLLRVAVTVAALLGLLAAGAQAPKWVVLAQSTAAPAGDQARSAKPVNPHGSFLAALVAAGYGDLAVDDIIALKDHGIDARFLAELTQARWDKLSTRDLIDMHDHGVPAEMLRAMCDFGFQHVQMHDIIYAWDQGVRPATFKNAAEYGTHLTLAQILKLKQAGVIQ